MVVGPFGGDASQFAKFLVELLLEASDRPWPHRGGTETVDQLAHACQYRFEGIVELGSLVLGGAAQVQAIACQRHTQVHRVRHSGVLSFGTVKSSLVEGKTPPFSRFAPNRLHDHCAAKHQEKPEIRAHGGDRTGSTVSVPPRWGHGRSDASSNISTRNFANWDASPPNGPTTIWKPSQRRPCPNRSFFRPARTGVCRRRRRKRSARCSSKSACVARVIARRPPRVKVCCFRCAGNWAWCMGQRRPCWSAWRVIKPSVAPRNGRP